ncbi:MAG: nucleoside hydrolase [Actinomycetota bacterium]
MGSGGRPPPTRRPVVLDHDGGVDDYLATALLLTMDHVDLLGVVVTPADCYVEAAVGATRKLLDLAGRPDLPVARSTVRGVNPFPRRYRRDSLTVDALPVLNERGEPRIRLAAEPGQDFLARLLLEAPEPATVLVTGPLTTLAAALDAAPGIEAKIAEVVWMGGALDVAGNVDPGFEPGHDMSAEWNAYWDPFAVARVWQTGLRLVVCPLDVTNRVPVTPAFLAELSARRRYPLSDFAGQCYALVVHSGYCFWDVLTTAYLGRPDLFTVSQRETVVVTEGRSQGRIAPAAGGRAVHALSDVDVEGFLAYVLRQWER